MSAVPLWPVTYDYALYLAGALFFTVCLRAYFKLGSGGKPALTALLAATIIFGGWDALAMNAGHWWMSGNHTSELWLLGMPLEEWAFFPAIGYLYLTLFQIATRNKTKTDNSKEKTTNSRGKRKTK
jgi:lycopene cyclase domain-containing protein